MKYKITLSGRTYEIEVEQGQPKLLDEYPTDSNADSREDTHADLPETAYEGVQIKAPLPGTVVEVKINKGDSIKEGDLLLLIEAMKMENEINSPVSGTVLKVAVIKGAVRQYG